jgi:signal recognition particle subunit SEC65
LKKHYKEKYKLLANFITLAKKLYYSAKLANSINKPKTTCNIIKAITNNQKKSNNMLIMKIEGKLTTHRQTIAEKFNNSYISVVENIKKTTQQRTLLMI